MARKKKETYLKRTGKVSLNIKVTEDLDTRLKSAREEARKQGFMFNVSQLVQTMLEDELEKVEIELRKENPEYSYKQTKLNIE